jgi:hypothetical protein
MSPASAFDSKHKAYGDWLMEVVFTTGILDEVDRRWWESETKDSVPGAGDDWRTNIAGRDVPVLSGSANCFAVSDPPLRAHRAELGRIRPSSAPRRSRCRAL